jgi:hypothetical protein
MSLSNEWHEYHLTPRGWEEGSEKLDFAGEKPRLIPPDRVLTLRFSDYQSCSFAKPDLSCKVVWRSKDEDAIRRLQQEHGIRPGAFSSWPME